MKELSLQEIKNVELGILQMFDSFCRENNIRYYLAFGTLLGAIRYKKFIPWDDDVDVLVPREDYDRLLTLFQDSERYHLYAFEKDPQFYYPFAKLCDMTTRKEQSVYKNKGVDLGVDVDIFPLDAFDDDLEKAKKETERISKLGMWLRMSKLEEPMTNDPVKRFAWNVVIAFAKLFGGGYFIKKIIKASNKPHQKGEKYVGAKVWSMYGERGIVPAEAFADVVEVEFEGQKFLAPAGYDTYLTCLYGDYLPEPPKEKQKTHHAFKAYKV